MAILLNLVGQKYNKLTVIKFVKKAPHYNMMWLCKCDCGNKAIVSTSHLRSGHTKSCGCHRVKMGQNRAKNNTKYKHPAKSTEYNTWRAMIQRCYNKKNDRYVNYGGRGITVCERWKNSYDAFVEDMGIKSSPIYSIDRIDNDGNYEPGNCRWATRQEQNKNRSRRYHINKEKKHEHTV